MRQNRETDKYSKEKIRKQNLFATGIASESEHDEDFFEMEQKRKVNQKFSKLMAFNLDKDFDMIKNLTGKHASLVN